jgi:hypothetical protein
MATWADGKTVEDTRAEREAAVALRVAWLMGIGHAFRVNGGPGARLDKEVRAAQVDLIQAILLACADGVTIESVRARFIDPVVGYPGDNEGAAGLLVETVRLAEQRLTRASGA